MSVTLSLDYQNDSLPRIYTTIDKTSQYGVFYEPDQTYLIKPIGLRNSLE